MGVCQSCCASSGAEPVELATSDDGGGGKDGDRRVGFAVDEEDNVDVEEISESSYDSEYGYEKANSEPEPLECKRNRRRNQTFYLVNDSAEDDNAKQSMDDVLALARTASNISLDSEDDRTEAEIAKEEMLEKVRKLVDLSYDILPAEMLLADLEKLVGEVGWREVQMMPLFDRFCRKLDFFYDVGMSACQQQADWIEVYNGDNGMQTIHGLIDPEENHVLHYRVRAQIPAKLTDVMAVANEIQLMKSWNTLIVNDPVVIGRRTAHYMVMNYQISALGGMYKVDVLNEIRRFSDVNGGFLAEYIVSVAKDHPSYREPEKGYKRMQTEMKNVICACGPNQTVLIQVGKLKLPFAVSKWLAKTVGQVAGKTVVGALVANSLRAAEPGNQWEKHVEEDKLGLYHRLQECIGAPGSKERDPGKAKKIEEFELEKFFSSRRFYRKSARRSRVMGRMSSGSRSGSTISASMSQRSVGGFANN